MTAAPGAADWVVVIPVKPAAVGKSRLDVPGVDRVTLARAIALDTIAAAAACDAVERVVVVSDDGGIPALALDMPGLRFVPEGDAKGLNEAVAEGMRPYESRPRAALLGDLPALQPHELAEALRQAASVHRGVVADAGKSGSTMVTAAAGVYWRSAFGYDSFAGHRAIGCVALEVPKDSTLRHDVDTVEQLSDAAMLGLGPRTLATLRTATESSARTGSGCGVCRAGVYVGAEPRFVTSTSAGELLHRCDVCATWWIGDGRSLRPVPTAEAHRRMPGRIVD